MPSISRVFGALGLCFLATTSVSGVNGQVTLNFLADTEVLKYNGDGKTPDTPLVGAITDNVVVPIFGVPHAPLLDADSNQASSFNNVFILSQAWTGSDSRCCYSGFQTGSTTDLQPCNPPTTTSGDGAIKITSAGAMSPFTDVTDPSSGLAIYQLTCSSSTQTLQTVYFQLRQFAYEQAPAQGQLDWVVEPVNLNGVTVPFLSHLAVAQQQTSDINLVDDPTNTATLTAEPTVYVKVIDNTASPLDGQFVYASTQALNVGSLSANTESTSSPTYAVTQIVACQYNGKTVHDSTVWAVDQVNINNYFPECQFRAVGTTALNGVYPDVLVSFKVHIRVMPPCHQLSATQYSFTAIKSYLEPQTPVLGNPIIYDATTSKDASSNPITATVTVTDPSHMGSFPFHSFLSVADNGQSAIIQDPIGAYFNAQAADSTNLNKVTTNFPSIDRNEPILCRDRTAAHISTGFKKDTNTVTCFNPVTGSNSCLSSKFPDVGPLVNDKTQFLGSTTGKQYWIECGVWDVNGGYGYAVVHLTVKVPASGTVPSCPSIAGYCCVDTGLVQIPKDGCCIDNHVYPKGAWQCKCHSSGACGDPQFTGFLSQSYQVHGVSGQVYNVLSTPQFQYNALFTYLEDGKCRKGTQCFSHPGNYFGEVGMLIKGANANVHKVRVIAGSVESGLRVLLDGVEMPVSSKSVQVADASLTLASPFELEVEASEFSLRLSNSDMFINQDVAINTPLLKHIQEYKMASKSNNATSAAEIASTLPHGLLGQTWQYKQYDNRWKYIQGTLFEYSVADGVLGTDFKYNRFQ